MSEWRPIETYPSDADGWGPNALLFIPSGVVAPASDYRIVCGCFEAEMWLTWDDMAAMSDLFGKPSHWMPLPEPPK